MTPVVQRRSQPSATSSRDSNPTPVSEPKASLLVGDDGRPRCAWAGRDPLYQRYHDEEWGAPQHDDVRLFEKVCLEGFQSGLSWLTILRRRDAFRRAFCDFDIDRVAAMTAADIDRLVQDASIIRHRGKITATVQNARAAQAIDSSVDDVVWSFAPASRVGRLENAEHVPTRTPESTALSSELRSLGFRFVGPTTMYALMQATGMVDDHIAGCHIEARRREAHQTTGTVSPIR